MRGIQEEEIEVCATEGFESNTGGQQETQWWRMPFVSEGGVIVSVSLLSPAAAKKVARHCCLSD